MVLEADMKLFVLWFQIGTLILSLAGLVEGYGCGTTFQLQYGTPIIIQSPYYDNNVYCACTVNAPTGAQISVQFLHLDLESNYDYVNLNGNSYSGDVIPDVYLTSGNRLEILFTTDGSVTRSGFRLNVFIDDETAPEIVGCPDDITITNELGTARTPVTWTEPSATDVSGVPQKMQSHQPGAGFSDGVTTVQYTFTDASNNEATCSFSVTVVTVDTIAPQIIGCPDDFNLTIELGVMVKHVNWSEPTATDASGSPTMLQSHYPGTEFHIGNTAVYYNFTDASHNTATCIFSITLETEDTIPPLVSQCPSDLHTFVGRFVTWAEPTASDTSNNVTVTRTTVPGTFITVPTRVVYTFSDSSENKAYCNFTIYVDRDTTAPTIIDCPTDVQASMELGEISTPIVWQKPSARDQSGRVILIDFTHLPSQLFSTGSTRVVYTFADDSFNLAFCNFSVVVHQVDTTPPTISDCPAEITIEIEMGTPNIAIYWTPPSATDLSGNVSLVSQNYSPGDKFTEGRSRVSYIFFDGSGNKAFCEFDINVKEVDTIPPSIEYCPENMALTIEAGISTTTVSWIEPQASDLSGNVTISSESTIPLTFSPFSENIVKYVFNDDSGNQNICQFSVSFEIVDTIPPVITGCPSSIQTTSEVGTSERVSWSRPYATDPSTIVKSSASHEPGQPFSIGSTDVVYIFEDEFGNQARCDFSVQVESVDSNPPEIITCPNDINEEVEFGNEYSRIFWSDPNVFDNSGNVSLSFQSHLSGSTFRTGRTEVGYLFTDSAGNQASCNFSVMLINVDTKAPEILQCPANIVQTIEAGSYGSVVFWKDPVVVDASGNVSLLIQSHSSGEIFPVGKTIVTYMFTDPSNNLATCSFIVIIDIVDTTSPIIVYCPDSIQTTTGVGTSGATVSWSRPFATDQSAIVIENASHEPGKTFPVGTTDVVYTYEDACGNRAHCNFSVRVEKVTEHAPSTTMDTIGPEILQCPANITQTIEAGSYGYVVFWKDPVVVDESGDVALLIQTHSSGEMFPVGKTSVTYIFTDPSNNLATCSFTISIATVDTTSPVVINCPDSVIISAVGPSGAIGSWSRPFATDHSAIVISNASHDPGQAFPVGSTDVVYIFEDEFGNQAQCNFSVRVENVDTKRPQINGCPNDIHTSVEIGTPDIAISWLEPSASNNSEQITTNSTHAPGQPFSVGSSDVLYTFTDVWGNQAFCQFLVTVKEVDTSPPTIQDCPNNIDTTTNRTFLDPEYTGKSHLLLTYLEVQVYWCAHMFLAQHFFLGIPRSLTSLKTTRTILHLACFQLVLQQQ
ncbi:hyalin-like [Amphiura filiformis]|uniref:hyalin-like n=1 Tax=Amphiura filiformis TaxID=82378 RepID=UPI003B228BF7